MAAGVEANGSSDSGSSGKQKLKLSLKLPSTVKEEKRKSPQPTVKKLTLKFGSAKGPTVSSASSRPDAGDERSQVSPETIVSDFSDVSSSGDEAGGVDLEQTLNRPAAFSIENNAVDDEETVDVDGDESTQMTEQQSAQNFNDEQSAAVNNAPSKRMSGKRCKYLKNVAENLLNSFVKKDSYGFFLSPVDIKYVPDYLTVIKQPMDFSTIRSKVEHNSYRKLHEFKSDVYLVFSNAKTYNAPNTVFYKTAHKIQEYADKAFQRIEDNVTIVEEEARPTAISNVSLELQTQSEYKGKKKKYRKRTKFGKYICEDGSLDPNSFESLVPLQLPNIDFPFTAACRKSMEQCHDPNYEPSELELLRWYPAFSYVDFAAFRTLQLPIHSNQVLTNENVAEVGVKSEPLGPATLKFAQQVYGEDRTLAYIESLKYFKRDLADTDLVSQIIDKKISQLTYGADALVDNTIRVLENNDVLPVCSPEYAHLTNGIDVKTEVANAQQRKIKELAIKTAANFNQSDFAVLSQVIQTLSESKPATLATEPVKGVSHGVDLLSKTNILLEKFFKRTDSSEPYTEQEISELKHLQVLLQSLAEFCTKPNNSKKVVNQQPVQQQPRPSPNIAAQYMANLQMQRPVLPVAKYPLPPAMQMSQYPFNMVNSLPPQQVLQYQMSAGRQLTPAEIAALQANFIRQNGGGGNPATDPQLLRQMAPVRPQPPNTFKPPN